MGAARTIDSQFVNGNTTIAQMFSGAKGAYCQGKYTDDYNNISSAFMALGGGDPDNAVNLIWPCKD